MGFLCCCRQRVTGDRCLLQQCSLRRWATQQHCTSPKQQHGLKECSVFTFANSNKKESATGRAAMVYTATAKWQHANTAKRARQPRRQTTIQLPDMGRIPHPRLAAACRRLNTAPRPPPAWLARPGPSSWPGSLGTHAPATHRHAAVSVSITVVAHPQPEGSANPRREPPS
jgi:hypothetical protein